MAAVHAGSYAIHIQGVAGLSADNYDFTASAADSTLTITKATPTIAWANPADITYGTVLSGAQLNATPSVPGTTIYTPSAGEKLNAGTGQALRVDFTPSDPANYTAASRTVSVDVLKAQPAFSQSIASPATIIYGQATISVSGHLAAATAIPAGQPVSIAIGSASAQATIQADGSFSAAIDTHALNATTTPYTIRYTYVGDRNFQAATSASTTLTVARASQSITFTGAPSSAVYGTTFHVNPTSSAGIPVILTGTHCNIVAASGGGYDVTMTSGTEAAILVAHQSGDGNHTAADEVTMTVAARKATATVTLDGLTAASDGAVHLATATTTPGGLAVNLVYRQGGSVVASPTEPGRYDVTATIDDPNYQGGATGTLTLTAMPAMLQSIRVVTGKRKSVSAIVLTFSGELDSGSAENAAVYRLVTAGKKGSFTAKNAKGIVLRAASYDAASHTVTLTPAKAFKIKKPIQLQVIGLKDGSGRPIDGNRDGTPGGNAVAILNNRGATVAAVQASPAVSGLLGAAVDSLLEQGHLVDRSYLSGRARKPAQPR